MTLIRLTVCNKLQINYIGAINIIKDFLSLKSNINLTDNI